MIVLIGAVLGLLMAFIAPIHIPPAHTKYVAIGILAALDSVFGGISAYYRKQFDFKVFLIGLLTNALLAVGLTLMGSKLDVDISLAAIVTFGSRLFQNLAEIRRFVLKRYNKKDKIEE